MLIISHNTIKELDMADFQALAPSGTPHVITDCPKPLLEESTPDHGKDAFYDPLVDGVSLAMSPSVRRIIATAMGRLDAVHAAIADAAVNMTPKAFITFFDTLEMTKGIRIAELGYRREYSPDLDMDILVQAEAKVQ